MLNHRRHHFRRHAEIFQVHNLVRFEPKGIGRIRDVSENDIRVHARLYQLGDFTGGGRKFDAWWWGHDGIHRLATGAGFVFGQGFGRNWRDVG